MRATVPGAGAPAPRRTGGTAWSLGPSSVVAGMALVAYLLLAPPVSGDGDGSEFTLVLATGGMAHPTGYPLYTIAGHLFCRALHALGAPWPYAANAWSAVGAALAIFFLHALATRFALRAAPRAPGWTRDLAALLPVVLFGLNPIWTNEAMLAEVYAWHIAWVLGAATFFTVQIERLEHGEGGRAAEVRVAGTWGLLCGLGVAHHLTSVLIAAPCSIGLIAALAWARRLRPALVLAALGGALIPLASYAYVAWRAFHPGLVQWESLQPSWYGVLEHVTGRRYQHFMGYFAPSEEHRVQLQRAGYPLLMAGMALQFLALARAQGVAARIGIGTLLVAGLGVTFYAFHYGVLDPGPYFLPAIALALVALAPAAAGLLGAAATAARPLAMTLGMIVVVALAAVLAPWVREAQARRGELLEFERIARSMWASVPPGPALVLWADDRYERLIEYQILRHEKPDLIIIDPELLADDYPRARFISRFGVDPLEGLVIPAVERGSHGEQEAIRRVVYQMVRGINARTRVPVILIDLAKPEVRLLDKPGG